MIPEINLKDVVGISTDSESAVPTTWNSHKISEVEKNINALVETINHLRSESFSSEFSSKSAILENAITEISNFMKDLEESSGKEAEKIKRLIKEKLTQIDGALSTILTRAGASSVHVTARMLSMHLHEIILDQAGKGREAPATTPTVPSASRVASSSPVVSLSSMPSATISSASRVASSSPVVSLSSTSSSSTATSSPTSSTGVPRPFMLSSLRELEEATTGGMKQIRVLPQIEDGTGFSGENCGFHSLKNALLTFHGAESPEALQALFQDKALFQKFYTRYCSPLLIGKKEGKRDADPTLVREIIQNFKNDDTPPTEFVAIQRSFKANPDSLRVFNISESGEIPSLDADGLFDAKKLCDFARQPGPKTITMIFGNETTGHWYTLTFHKNEAGLIQSFGSDSMRSSGTSSLLVSMNANMIENLKNPSKFMSELFFKSTINDEISKYANWVESDHLSEEPLPNAKLLLDARPNPLFAREGLDGSPKQRNIDMLLKTTQMMQEYGWLTSHDFDTQQAVRNVETLLRFYIRRLPPTDPLYRNLQAALETISRGRPADIIEQMFQETIDELSSQKSKLLLQGISEVFHDKALQLLQNQQIIYNHIEEISKIGTEKARRERINAIMPPGVPAGAETGYAAGDTPLAVRRTLENKAFLALRMYQEAKKRDVMGWFCTTIGSGSPCLNARTDRLYTFANEINNIINEYDEPVLIIGEKAIAEAIYNIGTRGVDFPFVNDTGLNEQEVVRELAQIKPQDLLKTPVHLEILSTAFEKYFEMSESEAKRFFLNALVSARIIPDRHSDIDWKIILPELMKQPVFQTMFLRGRKESKHFL